MVNTKLKQVIHDVAELTHDDKVVQLVTGFRIRKTKPAWKQPKNYIPVIFGLGATLIMFKDTIMGIFKPTETDITTKHDTARH